MLAAPWWGVGGIGADTSAKPRAAKASAGAGEGQRRTACARQSGAMPQAERKLAFGALVGGKMVVPGHNTHRHIDSPASNAQGSHRVPWEGVVVSCLWPRTHHTHPSHPSHPPCRPRSHHTRTHARTWDARGMNTWKIHTRGAHTRGSPSWTWTQHRQCGARRLAGENQRIYTYFYFAALLDGAR